MKIKKCLQIIHFTVFLFFKMNIALGSLLLNFYTKNKNKGIFTPYLHLYLNVSGVGYNTLSSCDDEWSDVTGSQ